MSIETPRGYIFRCSNATMDTCFKLMLFGEAEHKADWLAHVRKGDRLFLYNVNTHALYGVFVATSDIERNIMPNAWGGQYPLQVTVDWYEHFTEPLTEEQTRSIVEFAGSANHLPREQLSHDQVNSLEQLLRHKMVKPYMDSFDQKHPPSFRTRDGHSARSFGEVVIDDWLFNRGIAHGNESIVPLPKGEKYMKCDFFLQAPSSGVVYIEYWGMNDEKYSERRKEKTEVYQKHGLPLIELELDDIKHLDTVLPHKLKPYFPERNFDK